MGRPWGDEMAFWKAWLPAGAQPAHTGWLVCGSLAYGATASQPVTTEATGLQEVPASRHDRVRPAAWCPAGGDTGAMPPDRRATGLV